MGAIGVAIIAGCFSVLSAAVAAVITKYGLGFWRSSTVIKCKGEAKELRGIREDGSIEDVPNPFRYEIRGGVLNIRGRRASMSALLTITEESNTVADGTITGAGSFHNGYVYLQYRVEDTTRNQSWCGLLLIRVPGLGDLSGYWLTEDYVDAGTIAFGEVRLTRA